MSVFDDVNALSHDEWCDLAHEYEGEVETYPECPKCFATLYGEEQWTYNCEVCNREICTECGRDDMCEACWEAKEE